ncbi:MAG: FHA domain-containing protein, partial [Nannocystaceae bacterium]|nr:FHA domain-containing protein [Nannocystaceae bacterium]
MKHILRVIDGPLTGEVLVLSGRATLGRAADCDLQLLHHGVSRHHARLRLHDTGLVLTDLSSDNGTYVNGHRVERCVLESGDTVRVLDSLLRYEFTDVDSATGSERRAKVTSGESLRRTGPFSIVPSADAGLGEFSANEVSANEVSASEVSASEARPKAAGPSEASANEASANEASPNADAPVEPPMSAAQPYRAGESGIRRRSVQPSAQGRQLRSQSPIAADLPPLLPSDDALLPELPESPPDAGEFRSPRAATPATSAPLWPHMLPVAESPPVTSGSGAFKRPVAPRSTRGGEASNSLRLPLESSDEAIFRSPTTGRFATGELLAAHLEAEAEHAVPRAARGGSVALDYPSTPAYGAAVSEPQTPTPRETPMPEAWVSSDPRAELDVAPRGTAPVLDDRVGPRGINNSVDSVGTGAARFAVRGGSSRGTSAAETGEYPPPRVPRTGEYGALPDEAAPIP